MRRLWPIVSWVLAWTLLVMTTAFFLDTVLLMEMGVDLPRSEMPVLPDHGGFRCALFGSPELTPRGTAVIAAWALGVVALISLGSLEMLPGTRYLETGRCRFCGYDCRGLTACPECGC